MKGRTPIAPDDRGMVHWHVTSGYGGNTKLPFVEVTIGTQSMQMSPEAARAGAAPRRHEPPGDHRPVLRRRTHHRRIRPDLPDDTRAGAVGLGDCGDQARAAADPAHQATGVDPGHGAARGERAE